MNIYLMMNYYFLDDLLMVLNVSIFELFDSNNTSNDLFQKLKYYELIFGKTNSIDYLNNVRN